MADMVRDDVARGFCDGLIGAKQFRVGSYLPAFKPHQCKDPLLQPRRRAGAPRDDFLQWSSDFCEPPLGDRIENCFLVRKVAIDVAMAHAQCLSDVNDSEFFRTKAAE